MKKVLLSTLLALLACTASAEERYISMRNVDIGMAGQGYCSLVFNLTASAPFDNPLEIEVGLYNTQIFQPPYVKLQRVAEKS